MADTKYECRDCGRKFNTGKGFSDHFEHEGSVIVGCKPEVKPEVA